jgi:hypothetical protein
LNQRFCRDEPPDACPLAKALEIDPDLAEAHGHGNSWRVLFKSSCEEEYSAGEEHEVAKATG